MILTEDDSKSTDRRVATVGSFDGVHRGHVSLLRQLVSLADARGCRSAVITFRNHPRELIHGGVDRLTGLDERLRLIGAEGVDDIILLDFDERLRMMTAGEFMAYVRSRYGVDVMLLGFNNGFGHDGLRGIDAYRRAGHAVGVEVCGAVEVQGPKVSSTAVREALSAGDVARAEALLGRPYSLAGRVVHGRELGRTIGYPTANVEPVCADALVPLRGVYAAYVTLPDGSVRRAIMNIGHRPTIDDGRGDTIEVHVLDYDGDLYDRLVTVTFRARLRDERRFDSLDALRRQLDADADMARRL